MSYFNGLLNIYIDKNKKINDDFNINDIFKYLLNIDNEYGYIDIINKKINNKKSDNKKLRINTSVIYENKNIELDIHLDNLVISGGGIKCMTYYGILYVLDK